MSTTRIQRGVANVQLRNARYPILSITTKRFAEPRDCNVFIAEISLTPDARVHISPHSGTLEATRVGTDTFADEKHAVIASNLAFFTPYPSDNLESHIIGYFASNGTVVSTWEAQPGPDANQSYAITNYAPAINIDPQGHASIVTRKASDGTGQTCNEPVTIWNAFAGSAQIITNGVKTMPVYGVNLTGGQGYDHTNPWHEQVNARTCIGINQAGDTLYIAVAEVYGNSYGMKVSEMVDMVLLPMGVYNAINMDGGGSSILLGTSPTTGLQEWINVPKESAPRKVASSLAITWSPLKVQTGKSRITLVTSKPQTGKATLIYRPERTQPGKAAVKLATLRGILGKGTIKVHTPMTQPGKTSVRKSTSRTQLAVARITQKNQIKTQTGHSRIKRPTRKIMIGYAKIVPFTSREQTGKAQIKQFSKQIVLGIANIIN